MGLRDKLLGFWSSSYDPWDYPSNSSETATSEISSHQVAALLLAFGHIPFCPGVPCYFHLQSQCSFGAKCGCCHEESSLAVAVVYLGLRARRVHVQTIKTETNQFSASPCWSGIIFKVCCSLRLKLHYRAESQLC